MASSKVISLDAGAVGVDEEDACAALPTGG
jgi:hypothetical protein